MAKIVMSLTSLVFCGVMVVGGLVACRRSDRAAADTGSVNGAAATARTTPAAVVGGEVIQNPENDPTVGIDATDTAGYDLPFREEIRRKYVLKPQSTFQVFRINGSVRVESIDGDTAEVLVVRSATRREDLEYNQVAIRHEDTKLRIYREDDHKSFFSAFKKMPEGRQRVVVRLPKRIDFIGRGVNGGIDIDQIEGSLDVSGVNGHLRVAGQTGPVEVTGQNGEIDITISRYTGSPIEMNGINGEITLRFAGEVNATVVGWGNNGEVTSDLPDFRPREEEERQGRYKARIGTGGAEMEFQGRYEARIGTGGAEMEFHGINGNIRLLKAGASTAGRGR